MYVRINILPRCQQKPGGISNKEKVIRTQKNFTAGVSGPHVEVQWHPGSTNRKHTQQGRAFQTAQEAEL